jgi:ferredoxin
MPAAAPGRAVADPTRCIASENCVSLAPDVFAIGGDGLVTVIGPVRDAAAVDQAIAFCPVSALSREPAGEVQQ